MARTAKELKKLSKQGYFFDNEDEYDDYGYQDEGVKLEDFIEKTNNAPIIDSATNTSGASSDVSNPDMFAKFAETLDKFQQQRNNPFTSFGEIGQSIAKGISLLDPNGDKALLTTEQKVNYANNNIANLSDEDKNKLNEYNDILDELDASRMSLTDNFNPEENERFNANSQRLKDLKASLQQDLNLDDETFNKYVSSSKFLKNLEDRQRQQEEYANASAGEKALANIGDALLAPIRPYVTLKGYLDEKGNPYYDENLGVDHNATGFDMANMNRDITTQATKDIEELTGANEEDASLGNKAANEVLKTLYTGVKSGADSMARLATGEVSTLLGAGLEAADQQYVDAGERGLTKAQAIGTALSSGAAETVFEKIPVDNMMKLWKNGAEGLAKGGVKSAVKEILQQAGLEGMEEVETDIANKFSDAIINKDKSEFNTQVEEYKAQGMDEKEAFGRTLLDNVADTVESFAGGAIGGLVGGGGAIAGSVATTKEAKKLDGNYREVAQAIPDNVEDYNSEEDYNKAMEVKARAEELDTQDKVSSADRSGLLQDIYAINETMPNVDLIENINESVNSPFADVGGFQVAKNDITSQEVAQSMAQANNVNDFVEAYRDSQASSNAEARQIGQEYFETLAPKFDTYDEGSRPLDLALTQRSAEDLYTAALNGEEVNQEELNTQKKQQLFQRGMLENTVNQRAEAQRQAQREGQKTFEPTQLHNIETPQGKADIADITLDNEGNFKWTKGDEEVIVPRKDISDNAMQRFMVNALNQPTLSAKQLYIDNYDGSIPIGSYNNAYESAFNAGQLNSKNFKGWLGSHKFYARSIPESTLEAFFNEGAKQVENKSKKVTKAKTKGTGKVTAEKSVENTPLHKLAQAFASKTGIDVEIRDGSILVTDGAQNALTDAEGNEIYSNGQFQADISKVIVGANGKELQTFMHEAIGEVLEAYNPEDMADIQDAILNYLLESKGDNYVDKTIKRYQRLYQAAEGTKSYRDAANEMVNDTLVGLFTTDKGANDFVNWCTKNDKSVLEKITDFIQAIIDKLKSLISDANLSSEARTVAEMSEKQAQKIRDRLFKAMDKAIENYQGATEDATATSTRNSLKIKKQTVTVVNGTPIISGNAFSSNLVNKSYKEVTEAIQNELRKLTNNKYIISSDNREVYIGSDFADEYKGSTDTWNKNIVRRKAKANAIGGIEKIIETAKNPRWTKNTETKHNNDAQRGWTYYDIRFGIENPSNNAITFYEGILNVRMDSDGQDYVYDITKIKKENLTHSKGGKKISSPSNPSIPSSQKNATTTSSGAYSLDVDSAEVDKAYNEAVEKNDTDKLETMVLGAARANGYAYEAYHGTMNGGFFEFRKEKAKVGGNSGAGFYFSSNPYDSENNYEDVEGADNYFKWEELAEQIEEEGEYNGEVVEDHDRAVEIAKEVLNANPMTYHVFLKIENPFIRNYNNSTNIIDDIMEDYDEDRVDRDDYDSEDEYEEDLYIDRNDFVYEYIEDSVWSAWRDLINTYDTVDYFDDPSDVVQRLMGKVYDYGSMKFEDIVEAVGYELYIHDDSWTSQDSADGSYEFARAIIEHLGYDAIIDYEVSSKFNQLKDMDDDTTHYIMFNPNHVKSADNIVYDDNGNIVPLSERFDDSKSDIRYSLESKSDAEIDQEYMDAVEAEDMETLNRMVREYASMKGFTSPKVYHGTNKFGFTEFQKAKLDDKNSIFVAEDRKIASSYVGNIQDNTPISSGVTVDVWDMDNSTLIKYAQKYLDSVYRMATEKEVQEDLDFSRKHISEAKDNFVKGIKDIDNISSEDNEIAQDFIKALDVASSTNSRKEFLEANHTINMGRYDARSDEMADLIDDVLTMRVNMALDNLLQKVDIDVDNFVTRNGLELEWTNALITELEGVLKHGIYELYGKEDNLFELDAEGANWNRIKTPQEMIDAGYRVDSVRTRDISKYAREQGYNGVRILNVKDSGGKVEGAHYPSNIRIYFDSSSLKSADPITYDDNGDVIPLSERFNTDNEDIRFSLDVPTTYALDDYDPFIDDDVTETKDSKEAFTNSIIKAANDVLNFNISDKQVSDIADKMISDYSSTVDKEFVTKNLRNIFSAMNSDNIQDMTNALINLSEEVVRQSEEIDPDEQANYEDFIKNMPKIKLSEEQKNEAINRMGDWNTVFGAMGRFLSNNTTTTLDGNVYWQICDNALEHNYVMDRDATDADQLMNIIEAVENMRPQSRAIFEGGDITDAALVTANEIMQQYYGYALKDKNANANLKEVKADLKKQVDDYKRVIGKQYQEQVNRLNKQLKDKDNELKQLRAFNTSEISKAISIEKARIATAEKNARADKTNLNKYIERQERNKHLKSIRNQAIRTIKMLENPTRNKFIPEVLQKPTIEMLQTFDFVTYRVRKNGELVPWGEEKGGEPTKTNQMWREKMEKLQGVLSNLEGIQDEEDLSKYGNNSSYLYNLSVELGDVTKGLLDQFLQDTQNDSVKISTLNSEKLKVLDDFMKSYLASINGAQEAMIDGNNVQLAQVGQQVASEISGLKSLTAVAGTIKKKILDFLNLDMAEPITVFSELGGTMEKLYWHLEKGKDVRDGHIFATEDAFTKAKEELNIDKNEPSKWETGLMSFKDGQLQLTPAQVMSLYAAYGRSQARHHIIFGGVMSSDEGLRGKDKKLKKVQTKPVHLTPKDVEEIVNTLTPQQKALADFMVDYMSNEVSDWGNRVSQKRWGIRLFTESHYFPIKTFDVTRPSRTMDENANASLFSLQNQGFTKPLQKDANNALVLEDIFKVFSDHVAKMAAYDGYVIPINDFMRVFNYAESQETFVVKQGEEGQYRTDASVKEQIQRVFGTGGTQYLTKFIKNVNEDFGEGGSINLIDKLFSNNKAQAVLANGRVVSQQPTAYPRAMEVIDGKYLVKALNTSPVGLKKKVQRSKSHNTLAKFKSKGYYETSIGPSMQQMITGTATPKEKFNEVAGALAGLADDITWSVIYQAAEYKVQAEQKKLKVDSKEYFDAVNKIANEAFVKTQVVDSVFTKSQLMRSRDTGVKMLTAFMAEGTKYYNMLHRGIFNMYQTGNKKAFAKAVYLFVVGQVLNSVAQSAYDAWRDDDDEKDAMEKFLNALLGISDIQEADGVWATMQAILKSNLVENLLPMNLLPVVKEVNSALAGWDSKNMSTQAIYDIVGDAKKIVDWMEGKGTLTTYGVLNTVAHSLSLATGMPISSALREVKDLYNHVNDLWDGTNLVKNEQHESAKAQITKSENIQETVKTLYQEKVQENLEKGKTQKEAEKAAKSSVGSAITSTYKNQLVELRQTNMSEATSMKAEAIKGFTALGISQADANKRVEKWFK